MRLAKTSSGRAVVARGAAITALCGSSLLLGLAQVRPVLRVDPTLSRPGVLEHERESDGSEHHREERRRSASSSGRGR